MTPAMVAACHGHVAILETLLQNFHCRNTLCVQDKDGYTALHHSANCTKPTAVQCVQRLSDENSALLMVKDRKGLTAHERARRGKADDVAQLLVERVRALEIHAQLAARQLEEEEDAAAGRHGMCVYLGVCV